MDLQKLLNLRHYLTPRQHTEFCLEFAATAGAGGGSSSGGGDGGGGDSGASNPIMLLLQCRGTAADVRRWHTTFANQVRSNASRQRANESLSRVMLGGGENVDVVLKAMATGGIGVQLRIVGFIGQAEGDVDDGSPRGSGPSQAAADVESGQPPQPYVGPAVGTDPGARTAPARIGTRRLESFVVVDGFVSREAGLHNARQPQGGLVPGDAIMAVNGVTTRGRDVSGVAELFAHAMRQSSDTEMNVTVLRKAAVSKAVNMLRSLGRNLSAGGRQLDRDTAAKIVQTQWRLHRATHSAPARVRRLGTERRVPHSRPVAGEASCSEPPSPRGCGAARVPAGQDAARDRKIEGANSAISAIANGQQTSSQPPMPAPRCRKAPAGSVVPPLGAAHHAPEWAAPGVAQTAGDTFDSDSSGAEE